MTYWTTASGERIAISDMETNHIKNCIVMLHKNMLDWPSFSGEMAQMHAEREQELYNQRAEIKIKELEQELEKR